MASITVNGRSMQRRRPIGRHCNSHQQIEDKAMAMQRQRACQTPITQLQQAATVEAAQSDRWQSEIE